MAEAFDRSSRAHRLVRTISNALAPRTSRVRLRAADRVGPRARVLGAADIRNDGRLEIGADFTLSSSPATSHLVTSPEGRISIGDRVSIAAGASISSSVGVSIGDDVQIGPFVTILDTDFHAAGDAGGSAASAPIIIEAGVRLDARVVVLRGAHIQKGAWVGAGSVVSGAIPPGAFARGVPARVERASGDSSLLTEDQVTERLLRLVTDTFGLTKPPLLEDGPGRIKGWDSLGALRLLAALEDEFGVDLPEQTIARAQSLEGLKSAVLERLLRA